MCVIISLIILSTLKSKASCYLIAFNNPIRDEGTHN